MKDENIFCLAPWVLSHINMLGQRSLCCRSKAFDIDSDMPFEDYWNGPEMQRARTLMMNGKAPQEYCGA